MKLKYNYYIYSRLKYMNYIFFLIQFLFIYISCDCPPCENSDDCKKSINDDSVEFCCNGISSNSINKYFYIYDYQDSDGTCKFIEQCPDKVVADTNECVPDCKNYYEVGDFCFKPNNLVPLNDYEIEINLPNKIKYKCKDYTYIQIIDGKEFHKCIDDPNKCPNKIIDFDLKICVNSCENKKIRKVTNNEGELLYYQCRNQCPESEYEYDESIDIDGSKNIYCLIKCPTITPFYYKILNTQSPKCQKKCNKKDFYKKDINECISTCETKFYLEKESNDFFLCLGGTENCPSTHPYKYQNQCFKSCKDTQINILIQKTTYSYNNDGNKLCVDDCDLNEDKPFSDDDSLSCVDNCYNTKNKYHYNKKCVYSCSGFNYYTQTSLNIDSTSPSDFECVNKCPEEYYIYNNICLKYCKSSDKQYISINGKDCSSCKIPEDPSNPKSDEGFILKSDIDDSNNDDNQNINCLKSCPSGTYYKKDDNICYNSENNEKKNLCYFAEDNFNICYYSCQDIPNDYNFEKKENDKNICYKSFNCDNEYYYTKGGFTKCIDNNYVKECGKQGYNYLREKECVLNCNEDEYIIEPKITIYNGIEQLGKCCTNSNCDSTYPYYSESDKILKEQCSLKTIEKNGNDDTNRVGVSSQGTCVSICPPDYPYESEDGKKCVFSCPNNYYTIGNTKKCISNCKNVNKYNFINEKECLDNCSKKINNKLTYYYYDSNNICYTSCKDHNTDKFSLNASDSPQKCLLNCPQTYKYYFESDNICLFSCSNGYLESEGSNKCVTQCDTGKVVINNSTCSDNCIQDEPFIISEPLSVGSSIMIDKCVSNCKSFGYNFYSNLTNKCLIECNPSVPYEFGNACVEKCPEGYFTEFGDSNKCSVKCSTPYYIYDTDNKNYKCLPNCDLSNYYVSSTGECVKNCPLGENFIGKNRRCKSFCNESEDGKFYKKKIDTDIDYNIYLCLQSYGASDSEYCVFGTNEIVNKCPDDKPYLSDNGKICYSICSEYDKLLPFSTEDNNNKICSFECKNPNNYYGEDKICVISCDKFQVTNIINDENNSCVEKCDNNSLYKFETKYEDGSLHCSLKCNTETKYSEADYKCVDICKEPYNYVYENKCLDECPSDKFAQINNVNEYECKDKCEGGYPYYYQKDRKCIDKCNNYIIPETNECTSNCLSIPGSIKYYFYDYYGNDEEILTGSTRSYEYNACVNNCPDDKPFLKENYHCAKECNPESFHYCMEDNKICIEKCPSDMKIDGNICKKECPIGKFLDKNNNKCIDSCKNSSNRYFYYTPPDNTCIEKCDNSLYIDDYKCVSSCPNEKNIYADENRKCVEKCPSNRNYVVQEFIHNENNTQKTCLPSCPTDYPYYYKKEESDGTIINSCVSICSYYILPNNENMKSIECFEEKCPDTHNYFIKYKNGTIQCLTSCPKDIPYYMPSEEKRQCYDKCPDSFPYNKTFSNECYGNCDTKIIDYDKKTCVFGCSIGQYWAKDQNNETQKYCLNKCNIELGEYLSVDNECVKKCEPSKYLVSDITNPLNKKCKCINLFYIDDTGSTHCLPSTITECGKGSMDEIYKYRIYNTNQCTKYCFGYLSPSEDICYLDIKNCEEIDKNTYLSLKTNQLKCECKYRYYIDRNLNNKKICLGENEECPENYLMYNVESKECLEDCSGLKVFDNKCLKDCPSSFSIDGSKCVCDKYWYKIGENDYRCIDSCDGKYPYLIEETKQCVNKCKGTNYEVLYKNNCYSSCTSIGMTKIEIEDEKLKEIASYTCQCNNIWYYNNGEIICESSGGEKCSKYGFKYLIKDTNECVNSCPELYKKFFNGECFKSCEDARKKYQYPIKDIGSNECRCENLWKKNMNEIGEVISIECLKDVVCNKFIVNETNECVDNCPLESPLEYNNQCYKKGSCPIGTKEDINKCICNNLWFTQNNKNIKCVAENECPETHPFKIFDTKECILTCSETAKIVNNTCYKNCPKGTIEKGNTQECECDPQLGYWYIEEKDEEPKMICELGKCPNSKLYYINNTKQCISSCVENKMYEFNNICYEDQCPHPTVSEDATRNKYKCTTKKYATATNIYDSYKILKEEIVNLYKSVPKGGIIYNNFSSTMQVYGIKKNNTDNKDIILRSTLSYIDIHTCSDKVYQNNKMEEDDDIIVVKYDLGNKTIKSLIKPVEYEFINSRTGQVLDMSVCTKDDIYVSYSLFDILNYNKKSNERRLIESQDIQNIDNIFIEIQNKFKKGKEIYFTYNLDTFNINSSLYTDRCFTFEIDGKDLVLEDRVKHLYPYYSLCEENCTYSSIDFELERIYCNCPLKNEFDLNREHKFIINNNNTEDIIAKQKGPTNLPVLSCMSRLSEKKSINKNGAFFYSLIILIIEVSLIITTIFYNYKLLKNNIYKNSINNKEQKENNNEMETIENREYHKKSNKKENEVIYKTSERSLNYPPKKRGIKNDELNPDDIKLEKKINNNEEYNIGNDGTEAEDPRLEVEGSNNDPLSKDYEFGILNEIKKEHKLLRVKYDISIQQDKSDIFIILLTEICDKIYLIKTLILLGKYSMFSIYISLYLLCHLLLLTFITCFYDIKTISNIFNIENYPDLNYDLGHGFLACLIVWVIYRIFLCILDNENNIKKYFKTQINKSNNSDSLNVDNKKFNKLLYKIKYGMITYFIIELIVVIICLLYLTTFCAVYTGTKGKIFKTYGITLVEILIIKILYGITLAVLRKVGLSMQKSIIYKIVYNFDKYIY